PSTEVLDALANDGGVSALLAPNAFHHMGQKAWRGRFPKAISFAPDDAMARLAKKSPGINFESIKSLEKKLPPRIRLIQPDGMKAPDVMVSVISETSSVWFSGDIISNTVAEDLALPMRLIMTLFSAGTGYRHNPMPSMVYLKDKAAWKRSALDAIEKA